MIRRLTSAPNPSSRVLLYITFNGPSFAAGERYPYFTPS